MFLEKITQDILHNHRCSMTTSATSVCNNRFADDIDLVVGSNDELQTLINKSVQSADTLLREDHSRGQQNTYNHYIHHQSADTLLRGDHSRGQENTHNHYIHHQSADTLLRGDHSRGQENTHNHYIHHQSADTLLRGDHSRGQENTHNHYIHHHE